VHTCPRIILTIFFSQYAFFLLVLVILQIVVAVFAFMYTGELANAARNGFDKLWQNKDRDDQTKIAIEGIQRGLRCCGSTGPSNWGLSIPSSCCDESVCTLLNSHQSGCGDLLYDFVSGSGLLIAWFAIVFAGIELVGVIFACCREYLIECANRDWQTMRSFPSYLFQSQTLSEMQTEDNTPKWINYKLRSINLHSDKSLYIYNKIPSPFYLWIHA
jgi:hypothetical protein